MRNDQERLLDILEAIEKIDQHVVDDRTAFDTDEMLQVWVIHHLQIIGEASYGLSQEFRAGHPEIPWNQIVGMRHILVHGYFEIDIDIVWAAVENNLTPLRDSVETILSRLTEDSQTDDMVGQ